MLIISKEKVDDTQYVFGMEDHGMEFFQFRGGQPRRSNPSLIVLHWTGGEGPAAQVFRTLESRRLGVDFCIDREGNIFQFSDPGRVATSHCGRQNHRAIGIEIVNYGFRWPSWTRFNARKIPKSANDRIIYETILHGQRVFVADFYARQRLSTYKLVNTLCKAFDIPIDTPDVDGRMSTFDRNNFKGICGHYHLSKRKLDPGTRILDDVILACRSESYLNQI